MSTSTSAPDFGPATLTEKCPWCEQPIPHEQFERIRRRIRRDEQARAQKQREDWKRETAAEIVKLREAEAEERTRLLAEERAKALTETEGQVRLAQEAAGKEKEALEKKIAEAVEAEAGVKAELQKAQSAEKAAKAAAEKANAEAVRVAVEEVAQRHTKDIQKQREVLEAETRKQVAAKDAEHRKERKANEQIVDKLQRRLQKKTSNELGEGAELDLFHELRDHFPDDRIVRIEKGTRGADIRHDVIRNGEVCGSILFDSKNRGLWQNAFAEKLRADQIEANADHAILATNKFPAGSCDPWFVDEVLLCSPARVVILTRVLRDALVLLHASRLSAEDVGTKKERLYDFITSASFRRHVDRSQELARELLEIEVKEKEAHDRIWKKRGIGLQSLSKQVSALDTDVLAILKG